MAQDSTVVGDLEAATKTRLQSALKRVTTDRDVANARLFVASDALHRNTGVDLPVDGGRTTLRIRRDSRVMPHRHHSSKKSALEGNAHPV